MADAIPEGFITLKEAFEAHYKRKYGAGPENTGDLRRPASHHSTFRELTRAFRERELDALVRDEMTSEGRSRVQHWWHKGEFQERVFMEPAFPDLSEFPGRTAFTREDSFSLWSASVAREFRKTDPASMPIWTYAMTVAWIAGRSFDFMREEPREFFSMAYGHDDLNRRQTILDADLDLILALQAGKLTANGMHESKGRQKITALEWADLQWRCGEDLEDQWRRKADPLGIEYRDVQLTREDVLLTWLSGVPICLLGGKQDAPQSLEMRQAPKATRRPASVAKMRRMIERAQTFLKGHGFTSLTRQEAEKLLIALHAEAPRHSRREACSQIGTSARRRTQHQLANRSIELDDCRRFLTTAT